MKVTEFVEVVTRLEKKKKQVSIAQVAEIVKITKDLLKELTGVDIYAIIHKTPKYGGD